MDAAVMVTLPLIRLTLIELRPKLCGSIFWNQRARSRTTLSARCPTPQSLDQARANHEVAQIESSSGNPGAPSTTGHSSHALPCSVSRHALLTSLYSSRRIFTFSTRCNQIAEPWIYWLKVKDDAQTPMFFSVTHQSRPVLWFSGLNC